MQILNAETIPQSLWFLSSYWNSQIESLGLLASLHLDSCQMDIFFTENQEHR